MFRPIMLVEDDSEIRSSLRELLEGEAFDVLEAENGKVAIDKLQNLKPDDFPGLIILDMMMPVMSGPVFLKNIESMDLLSRIGSPPLIIASANSHLSPSDYGIVPVKILRKPYDLLVLLDLIQKHCLIR